MLDLCLIIIFATKYKHFSIQVCWAWMVSTCIRAHFEIKIFIFSTFKIEFEFENRLSLFAHSLTIIFYENWYISWKAGVQH